MLCTKVGKAKEFHWYIRRRDPDATIGQITEFRRKMVRLLSFNYDVHRLTVAPFRSRRTMAL